MWLAMSPLLLSGFKRTDTRPQMAMFETVCVLAAMLTPALAAVFVLRYVVKVPDLRAALGLVLPRPWRKGLADCALAVAVPLGLTLASLVVAWLAGGYEFDLSRLFGLQMLGWVGATALHVVVTLPFFYGEELGWQGYLLPRMRRYGLLPAYVRTGVLMALWHLPTLLMGGQYPGHSMLASVGSFVIACLLVLPIFSWLRLRSGSVLPAVLAHAVVSNVTTRLVWQLSAPGQDLDPMTVGLQGWPGWLVMAVLVSWLAWTKRL
ncbi:CPBP family intramembrane metalloprotease [Kribbella albertanoniae]|uniref:CPBP family intramembrane metalloprotease n=2 Tax=Kribbella albertanoniae TaxID=1266829 RepID=A0A4R4PKI4_9ACTN|nr:CPBP family intramembrane metalloprotease [Kribbella albertanoniae]